MLNFLFFGGIKMAYDLIISNYVYEISNEDFEKRVPDSLKTEFKKLAQNFEFPKQETQNCNPKDLHSILNYINNLHTHLKQDAELWLEMIGRIKFGLEVAQNPIFVFYDLGSKQDTVVFDKTGKILNLDYSKLNLPRFGIEKHPNYDVNRYDLEPQVQKYFNRDFVHCCSENFLETLKIFSQNHKKVMVKIMTNPKAGIFEIDLSQKPMHEMLVRIMNAWHENDLFIQDFADIRYEMRCFCVNGEVLTSAGSIEDFTWLQNTEKFDPQLQEIRNQTKVKFQPKIRNQLLEFARKTAKEITPVFKTKDFVLDVAIINGKPGIVELNPLSNSGLYACDIKTLIENKYHQTL